MDDSIHGNVLLTGEGDFSFSMSLLSQHPPETLKNICTTSLETEDSIKKHQDAEENIAILRQHGLTVLLQVDATKLHENQSINTKRFDRVIFNFPHVGGKSNLKKNRKLLEDFFLSAVYILKEDGKILVTLCKGQGGSPADRPMRAWHDSWQIVSMAANAGLILRRAVPFKTGQYEQYNSTGFRSQDKGFHTENAVTHVFEKAEIFEIPKQPAQVHPQHHINCALKRKLYEEPGNPVYEVQRAVEKALCACLGPSEIVCIKSPVVTSSVENFCPQLLTTSSELISDDVQYCANTSYCYYVDQNNMVFTRQTPFCPNGSNVNDVLSSPHCSDTVLNTKPSATSDFAKGEMDLQGSGKHPTEVGSHMETTTIHVKENNTLHEKHLRVSMVENLDEVMHYKNKHSEKIVIATGDVYRRCLIRPNSHPVSFEMICVFSESRDQEQKYDLKNLEHFSESDIYSVQKVCSHISEELNFNEIIKLEILDSTYTDQGVGKKTLYPCMKMSVVRNDSLEIIGSAMVYNHMESRNIVLIFDLVKISQAVYHLPHVALLWSGDTRVTKQFVRDGKKEWPLFKAVSLYPMEFQHDMSFWEIKDKKFDELLYCDIIRSLAGYVVVSVQLIDTYTDKQTDRISRCYRLSFMSCDKALSYDSSWKLQSIIRLEVARIMGVILR